LIFAYIDQLDNHKSNNDNISQNNSNTKSYKSSNSKLNDFAFMESQYLFTCQDLEEYSAQKQSNALVHISTQKVKVEVFDKSLVKAHMHALQPFMPLFIIKYLSSITSSKWNYSGFF
jgi:hypothetical protein